MYSLQYRPQMDHNKYEENGGWRLGCRPHFLDIGNGPAVACTVGCTWLMYSLCMAHIWPMYDLHMAHILFRSAIRSARRTDLTTCPYCYIWLIPLTRPCRQREGGTSCAGAVRVQKASAPSMLTALMQGCSGGGVISFLRAKTVNKNQCKSSDIGILKRSVQCYAATDHTFLDRVPW